MELRSSLVRLGVTEQTEMQHITFQCRLHHPCPVFPDNQARCSVLPQNTFYISSQLDNTTYEVAVTSEGVPAESAAA